MKLFTLTTFLLTILPIKAQVDMKRVYAAICEIEQGDPTKSGGAGNISYNAWLGVSDLPYYASASEAICTPVCLAHLEKLAGQLKSVRCKVSAQTLGSCWRLGFDGARKVGFKSDQGQRTQNLVNDSSFKP